MGRGGVRREKEGSRICCLTSSEVMRTKMMKMIEPHLGVEVRDHQGLEVVRGHQGLRLDSCRYLTPISMSV